MKNGDNEKFVGIVESIYNLSIGMSIIHVCNKNEAIVLQVGQRLIAIKSDRVVKKLAIRGIVFETGDIGINSASISLDIIGAELWLNTI